MLIPALVIMLPTEGEANLHLLRDKLGYTKIPNANPICDNRHLYIISDNPNDVIKESDWYVYNGTIFRADVIFDSGNNPNRNKWNKKILAASDASPQHHDVRLKFPQIPESFIEEYVRQYNKGNIISVVMVEYDKIVLSTTCEDDYDELRLKVTDDNMIMIRKYKESWSRKDVIDVLHRYAAETVYDRASVDKWIANNL